MLVALARREWMPFSSPHVGFLVAWLIGIWILQFTDHPG
jgi:hypothetical protein